MHCELCGKEILEKPKRVMIEGAQLETCAACGSLGTEIRRPQTLRGPTNKVAAHSRTRYRDIYRQMEGELDPDFDHIVKYARQKSRLTQEQLAAKIMEKALNVSLLIDIGKEKAQKGKPSENLTFGDVAIVKRRH